MAPRSFLLVALVTTAATATADPKFTHDSHVSIDVKLTEHSAPPQKHDERAAPTLPPDDAFALEIKLGDIHEEQAGVLLELIRNTPASEPMEKADYMFRLGELYAKVQRINRLAATKAEIELAHAPAGKRAGLDKERAAHTAKAKAAFDAGVSWLGQLVGTDDYRAYPHRDVALFYLGYTLANAGRGADARSVYDKLLKEHPGSKYAPDAHLAFAEFFFDSNRLADAEARYKKVLEFPRSSLYFYAMYKVGWVAFNLNKPTEALETFDAVARGTANDPTKADLHRNARKDFVRAYAEIGRADKALLAFKRVESTKAFDMLEALGDLYFDQGKADKAIFVYRELLVEQAASTRVCAWEGNVARAMLAIGAPAERVREIEQLAKLYTHLKKPDDDCRDTTAELTGQMARAFHQEATKTRQRETYALADRLYRAYLTAFPTAPDAADTRYFRAELLWARAELEAERGAGGRNNALATEQWKDAAVAFTEALDAGGLDARRVPIAADAAMLARLKALAIDPTRHEPPATDAAYATVPQPRPLPEQEQALLAAFDGYLAHVKVSETSERVDVLFQKAALLRRFAHHAESIAIFVEIVAKYPKHEAAETAAELALDGYNRIHAYDKMFALADRLANDKAFLADKPELGKTIATLRRQSLRKGAEELETTGKAKRDFAMLVVCGSKYVEIYNLDPLAADAEELLYNAGYCYEEGRSMGAAALMYQQLQRIFPRGKLTARSLARLGNVYAQTAFYREASEKFEEYATKYAGEDDAYNLLSDAVIYRKGVGDDARAIDDTNTYVRLFAAKKPADAAAAFWSIGAIYEKQGAPDKIARHYRAYVDRFGTIGGAERQAIAWTKIGLALWEHACPVAQVDGSCVKVEREISLTRKLRAATTTATTIPKQCGDDSKVRITVIPRDAREAGQAMAALDRAIALFDAGPAGDGVTYFSALARVTRIDRDFERYLAMPIPASLNFDKRQPAIAKASQVRFEKWFAGKSALLLELHKRYENIIPRKDGASAITAAARLGQLSQGFSAQLFRAEIPADLRSGPYAEDAVTAYCDTLTTLAEPLEADALRSYQGCLATSTKLGWFSNYSRLCERELGQLQPESWPTMAEVRQPPNQVSAISDLEAAKLSPD